jgi:hypothetical protein
MGRWDKCCPVIIPVINDLAEAGCYSVLIRPVSIDNRLTLSFQKNLITFLDVTQ